MGQAFTVMVKVLWKNYFPRLFLGKSKTLPPIVGALSMFLVKKSGLGLHNHVTSSKQKYTILIGASD